MLQTRAPRPAFLLDRTCTVLVCSLGCDVDELPNGVLVVRQVRPCRDRSTSLWDEFRRKARNFTPAANAAAGSRRLDYAAGLWCLGRTPPSFGGGGVCSAHGQNPCVCSKQFRTARLSGTYLN